MKRKYIIFGVFALLIIPLLGGCGSETPCPTVEPCPECPECPECPVCEQCEVCPEIIVDEIPFEEAWATSPHNDATAEAFVHWDEDDPAVVPASCAQCHSTSGYQDYVGADGSEVFAINAESFDIGETIKCVACHNQATDILDSVPFPSGVVVTDLGAEARCMICHQGRASQIQVNELIEASGMAEDLDKVSEDLRFINIHYYAAAATLYGTAVDGGYEYAGQSYDFKNDHVAGYDTCIGCHDSHSLELKLEECSACHQDLGSVEDIANIRMAGSLVDYDGDGDIEEGVSEEIAGLQAMLYQAMQAYSAEVAGTPLVYDTATYPYFFIDANDNGEADEAELNSDNGFNAWTARLVKAAYNYQVSLKDPGTYAHGGKYIIQLLYDSIADLNSVLATPVDLSTANRIDAGHFAGSEEAFRHWDAEGEVPGDCARCHSATGLPTYLKEGVAVSTEVANGFNCATCHDDLTTFTRYQVSDVEFPSGAMLSFGEADDSNLCIICHQGRESTVSLNAAINSVGVGDDEASAELRFRNPHYFAAGATLFGTEAKGAYEYVGQSYNERNLHVPGLYSCLGCHETHALEVKVEICATCHETVADSGLESIRITAGDFDGDGDETEGLAYELETMADALYVAVQAYATEAGTPIAFTDAAYPYFFNDTNGNGEVDPDEANRDNAFASWTPRLLRAAYNYQWYEKDPGAFAHNGLYMLQVLYDSLSDIGADVSGYTRPEVVVEPEN